MCIREIKLKICLFYKNKISNLRNLSLTQPVKN